MIYLLIAYRLLMGHDRAYYTNVEQTSPNLPALRVHAQVSVKKAPFN